MAPETSQSNKPSIQELIEQFSASSTRKRRNLISSLIERANEFTKLGDRLLDCFDPNGDDWAAGCILQIFYKKHPDQLQLFLQSFPSGWFNIQSECGIDYKEFQKSLLEERFEEADRFTSATLRELAGSSAVKRGYVYFSEVDSMAGLDLITLDRLWIAYSQGKYGFSVQSKILASLNNQYEKMWPRIGWKKDGVWTRYPNSFDWSLSAPDGHMPLINQLRGVRLMDALLNHESLKSRPK